MTLVVEATLPSEATSARIARRSVRDALQGRASTAVADAELLACELVTNALQHVEGAPLVFRVWLLTEGIRLEVSDPSGRVPERRIALADDQGGRGLEVIEALADSWGVVPAPGDGKTVWCEMS